MACLVSSTVVRAGLCTSWANMVIVHSDEDEGEGMASFLLTYLKDPNAMVHVAQLWHAPLRQRLHTATRGHRALCREPRALRPWACAIDRCAKNRK